MLHRNAFCALALLLFSGFAAALEIGFDSIVTVSASDNVSGSNEGSEETGQIGTGRFGVFGEQKGTKVRGAFSGEIFTQSQLDDSDDDFSSVAQFLGAVEWDITPRSFSWYVGDILGVVREDDALQPIDDFDNERRNVFITGPRFVYELDAFSRVNARLLYIDQSQDELDLETLYNASASWEFDTDRGNTWGLLFTDVFTDNPEIDSETGALAVVEGDFNRFSLSGYWRRDRGRNAYDVQLGVTRIDTEDESINGLNASLNFTRQLGPQTGFSIALTRDLRDQTLTTIETLFANGTGIAPDGDGFFDETRLDVTYNFASADTTFSVSAGVGRSEFRLLTDTTGLAISGEIEDRNNFFASTAYSRTITQRTRFDGLLSYENQDFINRLDNSQSILASLQFFQRLSRSFEFQFGYRGTISDSEASLDLLDTSAPLEILDITENRFTVGIRWAPPTRASRDLTIELDSLLDR